MALIEVERLTKTYRVALRKPGLRGAFASLAHRRYRTVEALKAMSFTVDAGELVGYIGPNGAGKSTTVKVLSGILTPDEGAVRVAGLTPWKDRTRHVANLGVVFGQRTQLWWDLPVIESFDLLRAIYRVPAAAYRSTRNELVAAMGIERLLDTPVRQLSLGQRMRCELVAALLHRPAVLFLDEPTIGLDSPAKLAVRRFIQKLNAEHGTTVILTTHDMDDIEALCRRVMVIGDGRILCDGTFDDLRRRVTNRRHLIIDLEDERETIDEPGTRLVGRSGARVELAFDPAQTAPAQMIARIAGRHAVRDLFVQHPPIDDVISELYGGEA